ncbi:hypothetical protein PMIN07_007816 [Paraphaeosphaeria minitans]
MCGSLSLAASLEHRSRRSGEMGSGQAQTTMCSRRARRVSVLFSDLKPYGTSLRIVPTPASAQTSDTLTEARLRGRVLPFAEKPSSTVPKPLNTVHYLRLSRCAGLSCLVSSCSRRPQRNYHEKAPVYMNGMPTI